MISGDGLAATKFQNPKVAKFQPKYGVNFFKIHITLRMHVICSKIHRNRQFLMNVKVPECMSRNSVKPIRCILVGVFMVSIYVHECDL